MFLIAAVLWQLLEIVAFAPRLKKWKRAGRIAAVALAVLILVGDAVVLADAASAGFYIRLMQSPLSYDVSNDFDAPASQEIVLENGGTYISDISYESKYPNGYLDVYLSPKNESERCPTFVFVHGGGFTWGDKVDGDPNGGKGGGQQWYFAELLDAGYNIVSVNYALAPEYRYPTPILQLCEATEFLIAHGDEYGLDMTSAIYSGGSAGGSVVGQFVCAQTDGAYSVRTSIPRVIPAENIKAVVFASALLDGSRYYKTGSAGFDFMLNECGRTYFGEDFVKSEIIYDTNIILNSSEDFPPTYLSDGNYSSFTNQARDLYERLSDLGLTVEFNYYEPDVEALGHGFEIFDTPCGEDNLQRTIAFLDQCTKAP